MLANTSGDSFQSPDETGRLDSVSAKVFKTPGTKIAKRNKFLSSHQVAIRREMSQRGFDLQPPNLLMLLTAVVLSIWISTEQSCNEDVKDSRALRAARSSRALM